MYYIQKHLNVFNCSGNAGEKYMSQVKIFNIYNLITPVCKLLIYVSLISIISYGIYIYNGVGILASHDASLEARAYIKALHKAICEGRFLEYSFSMGIGNGFEITYYSDPFKLLLALFPDEYFSRVFLILEILKHYLAAIFFYLYLKKINLSSNIAIFGALLYSFCGPMLIRSPWVHFTTEFVWAAFLLYSLEIYFQCKNRILLLSALTLVFWHRGLYYVVMYSLWVLVYALGRFYICRGKNFSRYIIKCLVLYVQAVLISSVFLLPVIYLTLHSGRGVDSLAHVVNMPIYGTLDRYMAIMFGLISENIPGILNSSPFSPDGLSSPCFYISIFGILLVPLGIKALDARGKIVAVGFIAIFTLYLLSPIVTYFYNLKIASVYYKLCIAPYICGMIVLSSIGLEHLKKTSINKFKYLLGVVIFVAIYAVIIANCNWKLNRQFLILAAFSCVVSVICVMDKDFNFLIKFACIFAVFELVVNAYSTNMTMYLWSKYFENDRSAGKTGNFEKTLNHLTEKEIGTYRLDGYISVMGNYVVAALPMYFAYKGSFYLSSYMDKDFINLLKNVVAKNDLMANRSYGVYQYPILQKFLGIHFIITAENSFFPLYREVFHDKTSKLNIWENKAPNDLITVFGNYIPEDKFERIDNLEDRQLILLDNVVLANNEFSKNTIKKIGLKEGSIANNSYSMLSITPHIKLSSNYKFDTTQLYSKKAHGIKLLSDKTFDIIYPVSSAIKLNYELDINLKGKKSGKPVLIVSKDGEYQEFVLKASPQGFNNSISIKNKSIDYFVIRVNGSDVDEINGVSIKNNRKFYDLDTVNKKNSNSVFESYVFEDGKVSGKLISNISGVALVSIPYDNGWQIELDGAAVDCFKVDYGLIGFSVPKGSHYISLTYKLPGLRLGFVITALTIWLLALGKVLGIARSHKLRQSRSNEMSSINGV